jgi:outer membrane lipoprotein SlyB
MISPREYEELTESKDVPTGALLGTYAGAGAGALKGKHGHKAKAALIGAAAGTVAGAAGGKLMSAARRLKTHIAQHEIREMNLRSTPTRHRHSRGD